MKHHSSSAKDFTTEPHYINSVVHSPQIQGSTDPTSLMSIIKNQTMYTSVFSVTHFIGDLEENR